MILISIRIGSCYLLCNLIYYYYLAGWDQSFAIAEAFIVIVATASCTCPVTITFNPIRLDHVNYVVKE